MTPVGRKAEGRTPLAAGERKRQEDQHEGHEGVARGEPRPENMSGSTGVARVHIAHTRGRAEGMAGKLRPGPRKRKATGEGFDARRARVPKTRRPIC